MHTKKLLIRIGFVALIIRVLYLIQHAGSPFFGRAVLDQHYYERCAQQLAGAGGNIIDGFRPLLYPLFASLFYRIDLDSGLFLTTLAQHGLGIGMAMMVAWLAIQFFKSIKAGLIAGLLFALSAPPLYFEGELLITTLFSFLLLLLWIVVALALNSDKEDRMPATPPSLHETASAQLNRERSQNPQRPKQLSFRALCVLLRLKPQSRQAGCLRYVLHALHSRHPVCSTPRTAESARNGINLTAKDHKIRKDQMDQSFASFTSSAFSCGKNYQGRQDACSTPRTAAVPAALSSSRKTAILWLIAGAVLGLAAQARPNALPLLLFFPLLSLYRFFKAGRDGSPSRPPRPAKPIRRNGSPGGRALPLLTLISAFIVQLLFSTLNAHYSGQFSLLTPAGGINFYLGNGKKADGMIPRQNKHVVYEGEYRDPIQVMAEQEYRSNTGTTGSIDQQAVSAYWKNKTLEEIKTNPPRWLGLMMKKIWLMLWNHEVPNNRSFAFAAKEETSLLRWLPVRWWLLLALLPWGVAALLKAQKKEIILWTGSFMVLFSASIVLFFVNSRFRIPLWPGMAVLAGGGAVHLWNQCKEKRFPPLPALASLLLILLSCINWAHIPPDPIENDLSMRASAYLDQGRVEEALNDINRCIKAVPTNPRYHFVRGNILMAQNNNQEALSAYLQAIALNPNDPMFHNNLGIAFENIADFEKAEVAYQRALALQSRHFAARTNLMLLKLRTGDIEQATLLLEPLLKENSTNPTLLCAQAILRYNQTGDPAALQRAQQLNPKLTEQLTK